MRRAFTRLAGGAILALASIAAANDARADNGVTPVTVQNPADIAKAIIAPHPITLSFNFSTDQFARPFTVPAKQRLLIEFVAGHCAVSGQTNLGEIAIEGTDGTFPIQMPALIGGSAVTEANYAYVTKIFAEAGQSVTVAVVEIGGGGNGPDQFSCDSTLTGELIDVP
jgi:hypothetical protein